MLDADQIYIGFCMQWPELESLTDPRQVQSVQRKAQRAVSEAAVPPQLRALASPAAHAPAAQLPQQQAAAAAAAAATAPPAACHRQSHQAAAAAPQPAPRAAAAQLGASTHHRVGDAQAAPRPSQQTPPSTPGPPPPPPQSKREAASPPALPLRRPVKRAGSRTASSSQGAEDIAAVSSAEAAGGERSPIRRRVCILAMLVAAPPRRLVPSMLASFTNSTMQPAPDSAPGTTPGSVSGLQQCARFSTQRKMGQSSEVFRSSRSWTSRRRFRPPTTQHGRGFGRRHRCTHAAAACATACCAPSASGSANKDNWHSSRLFSEPSQRVQPPVGLPCRACQELCGGSHWMHDRTAQCLCLNRCFGAFVLPSFVLIFSCTSFICVWCLLVASHDGSRKCGRWLDSDRCADVIYRCRSSTALCSRSIALDAGDEGPCGGG